MKICKKCKKKVANKAKICPNCGNDVSKAKIINKASNNTSKTINEKKLIEKKDDFNDNKSIQINEEKLNINENIKKEPNKKNKYNKMMSNSKKTINSSTKNKDKQKKSLEEKNKNTKKSEQQVVSKNTKKITKEDHTKKSALKNNKEKNKLLTIPTNISEFFKKTKLKTKKNSDSKKTKNTEKLIKNEKKNIEKNKTTKLKKTGKEKSIALIVINSISKFLNNIKNNTKKFIDSKKLTEEERQQKQLIKQEKARLKENKKTEQIKLKEEKNKQKEILKAIQEKEQLLKKQKDSIQSETSSIEKIKPEDIIHDRKSEVTTIIDNNEEEYKNLGKTKRIILNFKTELLKEEQEVNYEDEEIKKNKFVNKKTFGLFIIIIIVITFVFCTYQFIHMSSLNNAINVSEKEYGKQYEMNQRISYDGIIYKITEAKIVEGTEYRQPKEGYNFIQVTMELENISEDKVKYSYKDFKVKDSNEQESTRIFTPINAANALYSGKIVVGAKKIGSLIFEEPINDQNLLLNFYKTEEITTAIKDETTSEITDKKETKETLIFSVKLLLQK